MAMPATGDLIGTPASMSASEPPQIEAIDELPFDSRMSETIRMVYGKLSFDGMTATRARSARAPWPISRRPGPRTGRTSPTE